MRGLDINYNFAARITCLNDLAINVPSEMLKIMSLSKNPPYFLCRLLMTAENPDDVSMHCLDAIAIGHGVPASL